MRETSESSGPTLLCIVGPPAVGKMTVGIEIAGRTGYKLFHNHLSIEPVLRFFDFGTEPFGRLVGEFRRRIFEEVAASSIPGLIFTYAWAFDVPEDQAELEGYTAPFRDNGSRILYLELSATQEARLERNQGELRLAEKPSKRDLARSRQHLLDADAQYRLNSNGEFDGRDDYLRIDNTALSAEAVAIHTIKHFGLPGKTGHPGTA
ncbi:hypothetical protein ACIBHY_19460 [Nonomuraea sp. NPDC050547]|uniref:hypothetical protein n=1 Tax=Nonomuraea sp. NPDC050547 TaxID=3364368 RepID=UPI0037B3595D